MAVAKKCKDHLGNAFNSISDMCKYWGISKSIYNTRMLKCGWELKRALETPIVTKYKRKECIDHLGNPYNSIKEMCIVWGIPTSTYKYRISQGYSIEDALIGNLQYKCRDHLGIEYESKNKMCEAYNINRGTFDNRIKRDHMSLKDALTLPIDVTKGGESIIDPISGRDYTNLKALADAYGMVDETLRHRLSTGATLREALEKPINYGKDMKWGDSLLKRKVFGHRYSTTTDIIKKFSISKSALYSRVKSNRNRNVDVELLVSVPDMLNIKVKFVGLDGKARYSVKWSKELQTARQIIEHERPDLLELYDNSNPKGIWNPLVPSE